MDNETERNLLELLLPSYIIDNFTLIKIDDTGEKTEIYLEENHVLPKGYSKEDLTSHGFHKQSKIKDFPIRGKQVVLLVKRRRWLHKKTSEIISKDWNVVAQGTRMTQDFATFLKGLD